MAKLSYWMRNGMGGQHKLVDMGSVDDQAVRDATDRVKAAIGRGAHVQIVGNKRVTLRIPDNRIDLAVSMFPQIVPGAAAYCWCSHGWRAAPASR